MFNKKKLISLVIKSLYEKDMKRAGISKQKYLIILCGIPGCGKTSISDWLKKTGYFIPVSSDRIKNFLRKKGIDFELKDIFFIQHKIINLFFEEGFSVISDSNSDKIKYRNKLRVLAEKNSARPIILFFPTNREVSVKRFLKREKINSPEEIKSSKKTIEKYSKEMSVPKKAIIVNNQGSRKKALRELEKNLIQYDNNFKEIFSNPLNQKERNQ